MMRHVVSVLLLATGLCSGFSVGEDYDEFPAILDELDRVKRQVQYAEPTAQGEQQPTVQYATPAGNPQLSPEYVAYLQQVQAAQAAAAQQYEAQQQPADLNQVLSSRSPQRFQQQIPPRRPPVPEEVRRLQETFVRAPLREQEREDQTNQQLIAAGLNPSLVRRERLRQSALRLAAQQAEENAARQAIQQQEQQYQALYAAQQPQLVQQHLVPVPQAIPAQQPAESTPAPAQVSYSQVAFGSTHLPQQRLVPGRTQLIYTRPQQAQARQQPAYRQPQQQVVYRPQYVYATLPQGMRAAHPQQYAPQYQQQPESQRGEVQQTVYARPEVAQDTYQPQPARPPAFRPQRPVSYRPQRPQVVAYRPQPVQAVAYQPAQADTYQPAQADTYQPERPVAYQPVQYPLAEVTQKQTPDQYLIETTRPQTAPQPQLFTLPRRQQQVSYRPETDYQELQAALAARQQQAHIAQQQAEASVTTTPAPRSSIYVTTARSVTPKSYSLPEEYRSTAQPRPLSQNELNALINAGFSVESEEPETRGGHPAQQYYLRGLAKRQPQNTRPRIGKVQLSREEREMLAKNGIRSLYRVHTAETQDAPVTYVLAVENQKRDTDKSTESS